MENACWKCRDPTHHGRECTAEISGAGARREIQQFLKIVDPRVAKLQATKGRAQLSKMEEKRNVMRGPPPPVS